MTLNIYKYRLKFSKPFISSRGAFINKVGYLIQSGSAEPLGDISPLPYFSTEHHTKSLSQLMQIRDELNKVHKPWSCDQLEHIYAKCSISPTASLRFALESMAKEFSHRFSTMKSARLYTDNLELNTTCIKVKLRIGSVSENVKLLKNVRSHFPKAQIRIDGARLFPLKDALFLFSHFKADDFAFIEEPVQNIKDLKRFYQESNMPIALDETLREISLLDLNRYGFVKAFIIKPTMQGGLMITKHLAHLAKRMGISAVLSSSFESNVGLHAISCLQNDCINSFVYHGLDTAKFFENNTTYMNTITADGLATFSDDVLWNNLEKIY